MDDKIKIDREICIGCGLCAALAEKTFKIDNEGKSVVKHKTGDSKENISSAANSCPVNAIKISQE